MSMFGLFRDFRKELIDEIYSLNSEIVELKTLHKVTEFQDMQNAAIDTAKEAKKLLVEALDKFNLKFHGKELSVKEFKKLQLHPLPIESNGFSMINHTGVFETRQDFKDVIDIGNVYFEESSLFKFFELLNNSRLSPKFRKLAYIKIKKKVYKELMETDPALAEYFLQLNYNDIDHHTEFLNFNSLCNEMYQTSTISLKMIMEKSKTMTNLELRTFQDKINHSDNVKFIFLEEER